MTLEGHERGLLAREQLRGHRLAFLSVLCRLLGVSLGLCLLVCLGDRQMKLLDGVGIEFSDAPAYRREGRLPRSLIFQCERVSLDDLSVEVHKTAVQGRHLRTDWVLVLPDEHGAGPALSSS